MKNEMTNEKLYEQIKIEADPAMRILKELMFITCLVTCEKCCYFSAISSSDGFCRGTRVVPKNGFCQNGTGACLTAREFEKQEVENKT